MTRGATSVLAVLPGAFGVALGVPGPTMIAPESPMIFRPTLKLATKIKAGKLGPLPPAEDPLADWSSHLFVANRVQYILLSNTRSLYSTAIYGRDVTDVDGFIKGALAALEASLEADGLEDVYRRHILPSTGPILLAGASSRSVTGSMNELITSAKSLLSDADVSPFDLGVQLNGVLLSAISFGGKDKYTTPRAALKVMLKDPEK